MPAHKTHGRSRVNGKHPILYGRWANIKDRCCNPNSKDYRKYGGRGITICEEWKESYEAFHSWAMSHGFRPELQIDRIENDKGYSPDNCRWVTPKINSNNRRNNVSVEYKGKMMGILEVAELTGIPWQTLYKHYKDGGLEAYVEKRLGSSRK